jgi:hypothetical protein
VEVVDDDEKLPAFREPDGGRGDGRYGRSRCSRHRPVDTSMPRLEAVRCTSRKSRDFPIPGSPEIRTSCG